VTRSDLELLGCGALVGLAVGALAGWWLHPPPPAPRVEVRTREMTDVERQALVRVVEVQGPTHVVQGPTHTVERWRTVELPAQAGTSTPRDCTQEVQAERETWSGVIDSINEGSRSEATASASSTEHHEATAERIVIPQPPAPLPRWSLAGSVDHLARPSVGAGLRVIGPVWVEASVSPLQLEATLGLRVTF
jgi:hypothetical protein